MNGRGGYSLIEVLIAIFITGVVAVSIYSLYNTFFIQSHTQDLKVEAQQNARVALNLMEREFMNAGYAACDGNVIQEATSTSIQFVYTDPEEDGSLSATAGQCLRVMYALQTLDGVQVLVRRADTGSGSGWTTGTTELVAEHVDNIVFTYYDIDGNPANTSTQAERNAIRFVSVNLVTKTKSAVQGIGAPATFMSETNIRLRNLGVGASAYDTTAPVQTTGLQVRDPGICGRLNVKWTKNTEGDIRGYKVYYGVASGSYEGVVNIPVTVLSGNEHSCTDTGSEIECTISPSNPPLANSPADGSSTTTYYLTVKAYDNALNHSDPAAEVYGNPDPSSSEFDSGADDSTLNSISPVPVTGFSGADGPSDGQVLLSWTPYDSSTNPDVTGFRIYRSTSPFTSYPIDHTASGIDWIAGEPGSGKPEVGKNATSYTDSGGLIGCRIYYYAIAPVACDTTLLTDAGGELKYANDDYDATCGDGEEPCSPGTGFAASSGSDTAPAKTTPPGAPTIDARAGWKRVALSLTQPSDADIKQTCVYTEESATYPFLSDIVNASGCYEVTHPGQLIPDSGGIFTSAELPPAQSTSFWHDSMDVESPAEPSLAETGTYSYRAVSFDNCGNGSDITGAQATTILCGEDPPSGEKPPAVTDPTVGCCAGPVTLSWTPVPSDTSSPSSVSNPYDLAGYRVIRAEDAAFTIGAQIVSGSAPFWGSTFSDSSVEEGKTYYYRIASTDCPYERGNPSDATIISHANSGYLNSVTVGPVRPGKLDRDEKTTDVQDDHREVLTGVTIAGDGSSAPTAGFTHDSVTMFLNNTSTGPITVTGVSVSWVNPAAYLREVTIGGGDSSVGATTTSLAAGLTGASGTSPYTRAVTSASLSNVTIPGLENHVPITFTFKDSGGNAIDMRDDQFLITLAATNDSTGSSCSSYLTVSELQEGVFVPLGPSVTATQQNSPINPTFGYAVPGSTGLNTVPSGSDAGIVADSGVQVAISANIAGNTTDAVTGNKVPVSSATIYYRATAKTVTTAPAGGYTAVSMSNVGGDIWSGNIPNFDGQRIWYYVVGADADGNWDRDPEIAHGAYVYDQGEFELCAVTPSAPTGLAATAVGSSVTLTWNPVTTYSSGAAVDTEEDAILYRIFRDGAQEGSDQAGTSYTDTVPLNGVYRYTVRALNSCADPGPNVSSDSNTAATCVGMSGQATISVSPTTIYRGESFTVTVVDCLALSTGYETTLQTLNVDSGFSTFYVRSGVPHTYTPPVIETGVATGTFVKTIETSASSEAGKLQTLASDTITAFYTYASPQTATVSVIVDPCANTPRAPASLSGSKSGQNMTLNWSAVSFNTDDTSITDLAGYRVYEKVCNDGAPNCTGSSIQKDWFLRTSVGPGTTSVTLSADQGNLNQRMYHFRVTAFDSCSTPNESSPSSVWYE
ncbi:MAG: prepilin-type N-terminal cleavage/methylation domain-containing protein [Thermodesulfobacteriota bacterium]|nr:MAG: prepilin-type N-terminal cleavage/methylation domain-containing protein [Thermodesulfobacteriota bacterium]